MLRTRIEDNPRSTLFEGCDGVQTLYMQRQVPPPPTGGNVIALPVLPTTAWTRNGGLINSLCSPPNPAEAAFGAVSGTSVVLMSQSMGVSCCTCTARTRSYLLPTLRAATARLRGVFAAARDGAPYSVASMRVELFRNGSRLGTRIYAAENRPNNNCAGSSERPELLLRSGAAFDVPLAALAPAGASFDEIRIHLQGYGCGSSFQAVGIAQLTVVGR
jgi:hypothetical protein